MKRTRFNREPCPIARTTDLVGDWWTPMVMREAFLGRKRFDEFQETLGVSRAVLTQRLARLVDEGLLERRLYEERPPRHEYLLTDKGRAFYDVLAAMWRWGSDWLWDEGAPPVQLVRRDSGAVVNPVVVDERTGERIDPRGLRLKSRSKSRPKSRSGR